MTVSSDERLRELFSTVCFQGGTTYEIDMELAKMFRQEIEARFSCDWVAGEKFNQIFDHDKHRFARLVTPRLVDDVDRVYDAGHDDPPIEMTAEHMGYLKFPMEQVVKTGRNLIDRMIAYFHAALVALVEELVVQQPVFIAEAYFCIKRECFKVTMFAYVAVALPREQVRPRDEQDQDSGLQR